MSTPSEIQTSYQHPAIADPNYFSFMGLDGRLRHTDHHPAIVGHLDTATHVTDDFTGSTTMYLETPSGAFIKDNNGAGWVSLSPEEALSYRQQISHGWNELVGQQSVDAHA